MMSHRKVVAAAACAALLGLAGPADAGKRKSPRTTTLSPAKLDASRVSASTRKGFADFWRGLDAREQRRLEARLVRLEAKGDAVDVKAEMAALKADYPQLAPLSMQLSREPWIIAGDGGPIEASCTGIGWIGKNGRLRCIGRLTT
jgi:hypothetical protein